MTRTRMFFVVLFLLFPVVLFLSCTTTRTTQTGSVSPADTTSATATTQGGATQTMGGLAKQLSTNWPPDTLSLAPAGPGMVMLSSDPWPLSASSRSATYRLADQTQGGQESDSLANKFRSVLMEQTSSTGQGRLVFVKEGGSATPVVSNVSPPRWPPDSTGITLAGPGLIKLSWVPSATPTGAFTTTYRLLQPGEVQGIAPSEQMQGGRQAASDVEKLRTFLMFQPTDGDKTVFTFVKTSGGSNR